jgi:hypothetical protein
MQMIPVRTVRANHRYHSLNQLLAGYSIFTDAFQFETLSERIRIRFLGKQIAIFIYI